jgi:hypothetical protein
MKPICAVLVAAALVGSGTAHAQIDPAQAKMVCPPKDTVVPEISVAEQDEDYREGLSPAFRLALSPKAYPLEAIKNIEVHCTRGTFEAAGVTYGVYGGYVDRPSRYAMGPDPERVAYIASGPPPALALKWLQDGGKGGVSFRTGGIQILAVTNGDKREVYALFTDIPGDAQLIAAFRDALEGRSPLIGTYDASRGTTTLAGQ